MTAKRKSTKNSWIDPDDAPELTRDVAQRAQIAVGGSVIREATGTLTKRGRPPVGDEPKQQVTLRLAPKVIRYFKQRGDGWQTRVNETLEGYVAGALSEHARSMPKGKSSKSTKSFHLTKKKTGKWSLEPAGGDTPLKTFSRKSDATKGGVLEKLLGSDGGSVRIHKTNGRVQEERTYPRKDDAKRRRR